MDRSIESATMMCGSSKNTKKGGEHQQRRSGGGSRSSTATMAMRKGPWTEEEDAQLVWFVRLFGERRWDFLAKVSGLKRTGKSCRLRWVNYLHPGLRRGRITADEERLILELHDKWGSRWSRIARSLPGRTDNEIKNFWRTRTRKQKALGGEKKQCINKEDDDDDDKSTAMAASPSSSTVTTSFFSSSSPNSGAATSSSTVTESAQRNDDAELDEASTATASQQHQQQHQEYSYTMEQLWNEIAAAEAAAAGYMDDSWGIDHAALATEPPSSPAWEFCTDYSLWRIDDEEYYKKMLHAS